ncbi:MAG: response regulator [Desulfurivibrionaceae bacterium]|nr:response regulator [Desulfurivibrionaceae bacterium]
MSTILVLDDVEDAAVLISRILRRKGHTVYFFMDEDEALSFAKTQPLDLAILDMKLRKMDGIEVLAELKRIQPSIKAIMLTGYPTSQTAHRSQKEGAAAYCVKPLDKDELEQTVAAVLGS